MLLQKWQQSSKKKFSKSNVEFTGNIPLKHQNGFMPQLSVKLISMILEIGQAYHESSATHRIIATNIFNITK